VQRVVDLALGPPPGEVTHWTGRMLAKAVGISLRSVQRFAQLTSRRLKRGVFTSVADLKAAINRFVEETNSDPKPFVWTADPKRVLAAVKRGKQALESTRRGARPGQSMADMSSPNLADSLVNFSREKAAKRQFWTPARQCWPSAAPWGRGRRR